MARDGRRLVRAASSTARRRARATASASTAACAVPDPASRFKPDDVHGAERGGRSARASTWRDDALARPALGRGGDLRAARRHLHAARARSRAASERLDYLAELGVTAIELMPVADFPGARNWGYDGVLPFAPDARYGTPDELKRLVDAAHARGLMVLLDVVYNHFGPEGNYLHAYAPQFFNRAPPDAVGRGDQLRRRRQPHGARLLRPQRALLAGGVPLRRPAPRRRARDRRRLAARHPRRDRRSACARGAGARAARPPRARERRATRRAVSARDATAGRGCADGAVERRRAPRAARAR